MTHRRTTHIPTSRNRAALRDLQEAIREHQRIRRAVDALEAHADPGGRRADMHLELATCECSRHVRVAPGILAEGAVVCAVCSTPFRPVER